MKNHEYYEELVSLKVDDMLTPEQEAELKEHLEACTECRERLEIYLTIRNLSEELYEEPPANLASSVMYKVGLEKKPRSLKRVLTARIFTIAGAAAAITLLLYTGVFRSFLQPKDEAVNLAAADAAPQATVAESAAENDTAGNESPMMDAMDDSGTGTEEGAGAAEPIPAPSEKPESSRIYGFSSKSFIDNVFDPATAKVGDVVVGFEITELETSTEDNTKDSRIAFDGEATLSGTLYFDNNENGHWGKFIYFYIDDDAASLLPYPIDDDRQVWFGIDNYDEAVAMLDVQPEDEGETIAYKAMIVINSYTIVQGSSEGCNFATLKNIVSINRLSD